MLTRLSGTAIRFRRLVLVVTVLFVALAGVLAGGVAEDLSTGGFEDEASPSARAAAALERDFGAGAANLALLVTATGGVDDPAAVDAATAVVERLRTEEGVSGITSYWTSGRPAALRSEGGGQGLVLARLTGSEDEQIETVEGLSERFATRDATLDVSVGGEVETFRQVGDTIESDLARAESVAIPVTAVLLVLVFGSAVAAGLPLLIGVLSILGTFLALQVLSGLTDVSVYAVNLAISLGLGLGIDYSLFILTRYREEVAAGRTPHAAVVRSVQTAGRTVLFSALTVALSLGALLVFPLYFLRSFAYAGISAVAFAAVGAVVVLPAAMAALGPRLDSLDLNKPLRRLLRRPPRRSALADGRGFWHRTAVAVMKRPLPFGATVVALLLFLGLPFLGVSFGLPDDRVLPRDNPAHLVNETIRTDFASNEPLGLTVVLAGTDEGAVGPYAVALSQLAGADRVDALTGTYVRGEQVAPASLDTERFSNGTGSYLSVVPGGDGYGPAAEDLVEAIRAVPVPEALGDALVGGQAAALVDNKATLVDSLPLAVGLIAVTTLVLLFLFTGSVVLPVKAVVLNLLTLTAVFGVLVWVFQEGHLAFLIGDPIITGTLDTTMPILMFCVLFGLSMDYEVFLLSRIKEAYDATGDNTRAVALGLEQTGRLITAAAALLALVFASFITSGITFIKLLGLGVALAILLDATLVRGILVPALMRLMGGANWWAPRPLRRLHDRVGLTEAEAEPPVREEQLV